jgi:26S proteasome regulatory subunit T5
MTDEMLQAEIRQMESNTRSLKAKQSRFNTEIRNLDARLKENEDRLKLSTQLPHLISNIGEILDVEDEEAEDENQRSKEKKMKKALVLKTTARHTIYLPVIGLVEPEDLKPGELVAVNKESFVVYEKLPAEYDSRVKAMEVDERPTEEYSDIGGLDK